MTRQIKKEGVINLIVIILLLFTFALSIGSFGKIQTLSTRIITLETLLQDKQIAEDILIENNRILQEEQERLRLITQELLEKDQRRTRSISNLQSRGFSRYNDISANKDLSSDDMNKIIDTWDKQVSGGTRFKGHGDAFIAASKESGLNPIIILSHAAAESQWGNSQIAREKNNFFGINCIDSNPGAGYAMGNDIDSGIISGAIWIKNNFYNNGHTTLQAMLDANYASDGQWARTIESIANSSIRILRT